jgi:ATP-dependent helicase/nuclease subunit A
MEKAIAYEGTSYYGLFDFVRYIERLHSYNIDFGEAAPEGENGDTVRITTIHKSKGLEFPIVFVAGMGKTWNKGDTMGRLVMHPDLGIAADYMDPKLRLRTPTLKKRAIVRQLERDMLGEELRVLYVAMTRAKEKLILTGTHKSLHKKLEKAKQQPEQRKGSLPASQVAAGASYLDWLFLCLPGRAINRGLYGKELQDSYGKDTACPIEVKLVPFDQLITEEVREAVRRKEQRTSLEQWDTSQVYDENMREGMKRQLSYEYPYAREEELPVKLSVSQLKHAAMDEDLESCRLVADPEEEEVTLPRFLQKETKISGASRGTVYHKLLERLDMAQLTTWGRKGDKEAFERQLFAWQQNGILTEEEKQAVDVPQFMKFADTELVERMARAAKAGLLFREKPFVIGIPAHEMDPEITSKELVVVQGIIDVYWQEGDHIILLDYKTDRVGRKDGTEILKNRYRAQLDYYARALEQATGLSVTEKIIYSFSLGDTIYL